MKYIFVLTGLAFCQTLYAQVPPPGMESKLPVVLKGATIHVGNGEVIENGVIVIKNGIIENIGKEGNFPMDKSANETIDCKGKHIYPGFIATNTTLGITEIDAVRATRDFSETGDFNSHVRAQIAFNAESKIIPTVRYNGVLITQATPRGGLISGQSAIMNLDAWNWEDATISASDGIHLNWPPEYIRRGWWAEPEGVEKNKNKDTQLKEMAKFFENAKAYHLSEKRELDMKMEGMSGLFNGSRNLYIHVDKSKDIIQSVQFAQQYGISKIVIVGGEESHIVADFLKLNNVAVVLQRVHSLPSGEDVPAMQPYQLAKMLYSKGILYCLSWEGDMEAMNNRNLPFGAGTTVSFGVPYEDAVKSISLNTAKILGIDAKYGSLEKGKSATLFISEGDALDIRSNNLFLAFIDGRKVKLSSHQVELYQKYSNKYGLKN